MEVGSFFENMGGDGGVDEEDVKEDETVASVADERWHLGFVWKEKGHDTTNLEE